MRAYADAKRDFCNLPELRPATVLYERIAPDGTRLQMEVQGFECPRCGEAWLTGRDARRISNTWYRVGQASTSVADS